MRLNGSQQNPDTGGTGVVVIGAGYGGLRILRELSTQVVSQRLMLVGIDTDEDALAASGLGATVLLGQGLNCARGCGGESNLGERAVAVAAADLRKCIAGARLLIVCTGLGGGTGTGSVVSLARHARDLGVPSFFLATLPFAFEGSWKAAQAEGVLSPLREHADAVVAVPNDALFSHYAADIDAGEAFVIADRLVAECMGGLASTVWADKLLSADFGVIKTALNRNQGLCLLAAGRGTGEHRWRDAADNFLNCPLIGSPDSLNQVTDAVVNLQAACPVSIADVSACVKTLEAHFPKNVRLSFGVCRVDHADADIQLTGILCHGGAADVPPLPGAEESQAELQSALHAAAAPLDRPTSAGRPIQAELPIQEYSLGVFADASPTRYHGENLDVPTFQRRSIQLDLA